MATVQTIGTEPTGRMPAGTREATHRHPLDARNMMPIMTEADNAAVDEAIASVEGEFATMFIGVKRNMHRRATRVHECLQPLGFNILNTLSRLGPTHAGRLAELLEVDKSIISRQAKMLEDLGLLAREQDPDDRRATFFVITPEAEARMTEVRLTDQRLLHEGLRDWSLDDLSKLAELLAKLNAMRPHAYDDESAESESAESESAEPEIQASRQE
jgi:DNA-binding MarR family transcriptional regulator